MKIPIGIELKAALRQRIKDVVLQQMTPRNRKEQAIIITEKVLQCESFRGAKGISVYLSTASEVDTTRLLLEMFRLCKDVFVPAYNRNTMEMLRLRDMADYHALPTTKWGIKQPASIPDGRENALTNGDGIDLFLIPGVAFTMCGKRLGHGGGYYDKYLKRHQAVYPHKKVTLMALAFREQIVDANELQTEQHDVTMHEIVTCD